MPKNFKDLGVDELFRSAIEDFALPVEEEDRGKRDVLLAAFMEGGVSFEDYLEQHPEFREPVTSGPPVVELVEEEFIEGVTVVPEEQVVVRVAEPPKPTVKEKYLIKMVRENARFDVPGHSFTQNHPYALVDETTANYLLTKEEGFRQATPAELTEFYG